MDYDFESKYQHYSNTELLNILREAHRYQEAAVEAAKKILLQRNPSEVDAEWRRMQHEQVQSYQPVKADERISIFDDEPNYVTAHVRTLRNLVFGVYAFHVVLCLISLASLYAILDDVIATGVVPTMLLVLLLMGLYIATCVLVLQRSRSGWHLAIGLAIVNLITQAGGFALGLFSYYGLASVQPLAIVDIVLTAGVIIIMRREDMRSYYDIPGDIMRRNVLISVLAGVCYFAIRHFLF